MVKEKSTTIDLFHYFSVYPVRTVRTYVNLFVADNFKQNKNTVLHNSTQVVPHRIGMSWLSQFVLPLDQGGSDEPVAVNEFDSVGAPAGAPAAGVPLYYFCVVTDLLVATNALATHLKKNLHGIVLNSHDFQTLMEVQNETFNLIIVAHGKANDPTLYRTGKKNPTQIGLDMDEFELDRDKFGLDRDDIIDKLNKKRNTVTIYPCVCENLQGESSTSMGTVLWDGYSYLGVNNADFIHYLNTRRVKGIHTL